MTETSFMFSLSEREFDALAAGQTVKRYFHAGKEILLVVCWNKIKTKLQRQNNCVMKRGITVANIPLTNRDITKIAKGDAVIASYGAFVITVYLEEKIKKTFLP